MERGSFNWAITVVDNSRLPSCIPPFDRMPKSFARLVAVPKPWLEPHGISRNAGSFPRSWKSQCQRDYTLGDWSTAKNKCIVYDQITADWWIENKKLLQKYMMKLANHTGRWLPITTIHILRLLTNLINYLTNFTNILSDNQTARYYLTVLLSKCITH